MNNEVHEKNNKNINFKIKKKSIFQINFIFCLICFNIKKV